MPKAKKHNRSGVWARMRPWVVNPVTSAVLLLLLLIDLSSLPRHWAQGGESIMARAVLGAPHLLADPTSIEAYFAVNDGRLVQTFPNDDSWDTMARRLAQDPQHVLMLHLSFGQRMRGVWAMTAQTRWFTIRENFGSALSPVERREARRLFVDSLRSRFPEMPDSAWSDLLVSSWGKVRILWLGYLHDAAALCCLILFALSLQWVQRVPEWVRRYLIRKARPGTCQSCGYPTVGLVGTVCPECGSTIIPQEKTPV